LKEGTRTIEKNKGRAVRREEEGNRLKKDERKKERSPLVWDWERGKEGEKERCRIDGIVFVVHTVL
jgi:hypothetical protein